MCFRIMRNVVFVVFLFVLVLPRPAAAELNIAVVDVDSILKNSKAAKSISKQVDEKRKSFIASVKKEEDKLRAEQQAIESKREEMSQDELIKKAQDFDKRRIEARKSIQDKKGSLDKAYSVAMNTLTNTIYEICQAIADEKKIDLVITRQNIIVGNLSLDITKEVLERMDKKLPELKIKD